MPFYATTISREIGVESTYAIVPAESKISVYMVVVKRKYAKKTLVR